MPKFQRGQDFPHEGFVQTAIERYFCECGYKIIEEGYSDLVCVNAEIKWVVEAKGVTTAIGLDFRTGLGQLIQRMVEKDTIYAIAVPKTSQFIMQCGQISKWVRESLNIHFLLVDKEGDVQIVFPHEDLYLP